MTSVAEPTRANILFVCTGNVARSPYLEYRLRRLLESSGATDFTVASAGVHALSGHPVAPRIAAALDAAGISTADATGKRLTADMLSRADIVLTAERTHVPDVTRLNPAVMHRTFTARQFARLLRAEPAAESRGTSAREAVRLIIESAQRARGLAGRQTDDDDIPDPWRRPSWIYRRSIAAMDDALDVVSARLVALSPAR